MPTLEERQAALQASTPEPPQQPPPKTGGDSIERFNRGARAGFEGFIRGTATELGAALQGTSPVITTLTGKPNYRRIGGFATADFGPVAITDAGKWIDVDPTLHVILPDPQTGKPTVYARSEETDEDLSAAARLLSFGAVASPVTGLPGGGGAGMTRPVSAARGLVDDFANAGVDPTLAAVSDSRNVQNVATALRETPTAGGTIQRGVERGVEQTAEAVEQTAAGAGQAVGRQAGGESALRGAQTFRGTLSDNIDLADDAIHQIIRTPVRNLNRSEGSGFTLKSRALFDRADKFFKPSDVVKMDNTREVLAGLESRFNNPSLAQEFIPDRFTRWAKIIDESGGSMSFNDMRLFRTEIGRMLRQPQGVMQQDLDRELLGRLYSGLSSDMLDLAKSKGPDAVKAVTQANEFYRAGADRMRGALKQMLKPDANGEATFDLLLKKAGETGGANAKDLLAIRRSIPDEDWGDVAASIIREMGRPKPGVADPLDAANFSLSSYLTNFNKLSDEGKGVVFKSAGMGELSDQMDTLSRVVAAQQRVQRLQNASRSGTVGITGALGLMAVLEGGIPFGTIAAGVGSYAAGRLMMSPKFVKWLHTAPTTSWGSRKWASHAAKLTQLSNDEGLKEPLEILQRSLEQAGVGAPTAPPLGDLEKRQKTLRINAPDGVGQATPNRP